MRPPALRTAALLALALAPSLPAAQGERAPAGASLIEALSRSRRADELPRGYAAVGRGTLLSFDELDRTLVRRHALSPTGKEALRHLVELRVLEHLGREQGILISAAELAEAFGYAERQVKAALGVELADYLREHEIGVAEFRETLRLGLVHRHLTARALGLPEGSSPTPEEQRIWLDQTIERRGLEELRPPFAAGIAGRCGAEVEIGAAEFVETLRESLEPELVDEAAFHLLLEKRLTALVPALADPAAGDRADFAQRLERAIDAELERRRAEALSNPAYHGIAYETLLSAQGFLVEDLRNDPMVRVAALTSALVDERHDDAALQAEYERRRSFYEGRFGEAVRGRYLLLRAGVLEDGLEPRSIEQARAELEAIAPALGDEQRFTEAAVRVTEDVLTRAMGGDLGWVHRDEPRVLPELRAELFAAALEQPLPAGGRVAGPVRLPEGLALIFVAERRPSPGFGDEMRANVRQELRKALVEETLVPRDVRTFLEAPPGTAADTGRGEGG